MDIYDNLKIDADVRTIYSAVTTPKGIQGWWCLNSEIAPSIGGTHTMNFIKEGKPVVMKFKVDELTPYKKVAWTCSDNGNPMWLNTTVIFEIHENSEMDFTHANFDEQYKGSENFQMIIEGWKHFIHSLKDYCETGKGQPW